jgi:hypothetical protein
MMPNATTQCWRRVAVSNSKGVRLLCPPNKSAHVKNWWISIEIRRNPNGIAYAGKLLLAFLLALGFFGFDFI